MNNNISFQVFVLVAMSLVGMFGITSCGQEQNNEATTDQKLPAKEIVEKLKSIQDFEKATNYYQLVLPKIKSDNSKATRDYWLNELHLSFKKKLNDQIRQFCRESSTYEAQRLKQLSELLSLVKKELEGLSAEKDQLEQLDDLEVLLDQYEFAFVLPRHFEQQVYHRLFDKTIRDQKASSIDRIINTECLKDNPVIADMMQNLKNDLEVWEAHQVAYANLVKENDAVKVINFDCGQFTNDAYYTACEQWRYETYIGGFLKGVKGKNPKDFQVASYVRNLDCYELRDAPDSKILAGKELDNEKGSFYRDCRMLQRMFEK